MADYSEVRKILAISAQSQDEAIEKDRLERTITSVRTQRLAQNPIVGKYDFEHLSKIHKYLFEGLYDHAGELRPETEYWRKQSADNTMLTEFAKASDCITIIKETSNFIIDNNYLKDLDRENFLYEFAVSYAEFNYAHPFLEGNSRVTRILFQQLAQEAGYAFDSQKIDKAEWDAACIRSCNHYILYEQEDGTKIGEEQEQNIYPLIDIMDKVLVKKKRDCKLVKNGNITN